MVFIILIQQFLNEADKFQGGLMKLLLSIVFSFVLLFLPLLSHALCVKSPLANIRSGPGEGYQEIWQVSRFMPLKHVGTSVTGDWYAVSDVDGDVNWIYSSLVTDEYKCAVVKSKIVNVRTGPGTNYRKKFSRPASRYHALKVLETKGVWIKVEDAKGNVGWIHKNYLWFD
jgi:SH3-like domain-containing protein